MFQLSKKLLHVQSHQKKRAQHPNAGTRFGRVYNRSFIRYGFGGFGMSVYTPKKDRRFRVLPMGRPESGHNTDHSGLSSTTRTLSPNYRMFALKDGGVLVSHPSHAQIMRWGQRVQSAEAEATGSTVMDRYVNARMQSILADNSIEHTSLSQWRKAHMWHLVKSHGQLQRRWGSPSFVQGARSTLYNNK